MTDKQIIIDEIDMSGCCHQGKDNTCTCPHYKKECGKNPNCHYKIMQRQTKKLDKFYKSELELKQKLFRKEQECEELKEGYSELTEIVAPYMDDFTGYNEELGGFDIVLCVKELMEQLEAYKMEAEEGKEINAELKAKLTRANCQIADDEILQCDMREAIEELKAENDELKDLNTRLDNQRETYWKGYQKLKNCSTEIKEIAEKIDDSGGCDYGDYDCDNCSSLEQETVCTYKVKKLILQKISDLEV